ncbi:hypothetical protein BKA66DRAFT_560279 [Pyrenochaeta sp. MPI-SDFR-AT-0127]|nr:hypothetical protein BKA66DRAFT_560279 [Pyrenochaeta sp. MPI-SDFR-AT-0127]
MLRRLNPRRNEPQRRHTTINEQPRPQPAHEIKTRVSIQPRPVLSSKTDEEDVDLPVFLGNIPPPKSLNAQLHPDRLVPHLTQTPWEAERHKKNPAWRRSKLSYQLPEHVFRKLPREVYDCVLAQLEQIHLSQSEPCALCHLKDLYNLSLTNRAWDRAVRSIIMNPGASRLKLLRRTLRERHALARTVRELHLSDFQALYQSASIEREEIVNLVASLVMACPYLERLVGFHIPFQNSFDRLSHALSSRTNLKERVWLLTEADTELSDDETSHLGAYYHTACDPVERFLGLNSKYPLLSTFVLHQDQGETTTSLNFRAVVGTLRQFPVLRHLSISGLPATSFTNMALNALPPNLHSLRLENLPGINDKGLERFTTSQQARTLKNLTMINLDMASLTILSKILSHNLANLKHFSLTQDKAPGLSSQLSVPDFHSSSLESLHWEFRSEAGPFSTLTPSLSPSTPKLQTFPFANPEPICCLATTLLASAIESGAFPSLRRIRIPHDPQGVIQALCRPLATALLHSDAALLQMPSRISGSNAFSIMFENNGPISPKMHGFSAFVAPSSPRADSAMDTPTSLGSSGHGPLTPMRTRLAAHSRILAAKRDSFMMFRVQDPEGAVRLEKSIGGFTGRVGSKITYVLKADRSRTPGAAGDERSEHSQWITGIEDLADFKPRCQLQRVRVIGATGDGRNIGSCLTVSIFVLIFVPGNVLFTLAF